MFLALPGQTEATNRAQDVKASLEKDGGFAGWDEHAHRLAQEARRKAGAID